jgi:pyruvate/2-oxoglutarate dehydrogenase complex dihydrolipoamide dehydrogenase (E3) component
MNRDYDYDLICIGSGSAGQRAAVQAAKLGKKVAVIEKQRCIGGVCIETGTIRKAFLCNHIVTQATRTSARLVTKVTHY